MENQQNTGKTVSSSEKGHAKNIANLNLLNSYIEVLGTTYNPSNPALLLSNLRLMYTNALEKQRIVNTLQAPYALAVDNREQLFIPLSKKITKIKKAFKSTAGVSQAQMDDFMTISRQLKGEKKSAAAKEETTDEQKKEHSVSQLSYDKRTNNMDLLISLLQNTENYNPNEPEFQITTLQDLKDQMLESTQAVIINFVPLNNARTIRDEILYYADENLVDLGNRAKDYIASILDHNTAQYKAIMNIRFRKP